MSGVIDGNGQQWEHCNICGKFVKFPQNLGYLKPCEKHPNGADICCECTDMLIRAFVIDFEDIKPAPDWKVYESAY